MLSTILFSIVTADCGLTKLNNLGSTTLFKVFIKHGHAHFCCVTESKDMLNCNNLRKIHLEAMNLLKKTKPDVKDDNIKRRSQEK